MALNLDAVGKKLGPVSKDYNWKDVVLYALGVGAGFSDLDYCYEKNLKVIPSFSIASIFEFLSHYAANSDINLAGILHGEQDLIFHNPIPTEGTLITEGKITHMYDKGEKGALVIGESDTFHSNGKKLFTSIVTIFSRLDGGFNGEKAPKETFEYPDKKPDFEIDASPTLDQPLIYRLSGDVFALHVDSEFAKMAGFEKPIMHGLCTYGYSCRALIQSLTPGEPEKVRRLKCRFSKPIYPGDPIKTQIWKIEDNKAVWKTINAKTGEEVITNGIFEFGDIPKDEIRFDDQVAIITGAGGGLGRIYALELAKRGAKVVVNDLGGARDGSGEGSATPAQKVVDEIKALGGEAVANYDSVSTPDGGENIVKAALDAYGTVDILINNAGILRDKSFIKMEPENWQTVLDVHLTGAYNVTKPAFKVMREKGYGRIVMTTSAAGLYGNFGQTNYSSAKMGLAGLMNTLKLEGKKYNIKVNTVAPIAASRLTEDILPPELFEKMKPEFVSPLVMYLCSQECDANGNIYNAGMGFFNRAAVVTGSGTTIGDGVNPPEIEDVVDNFDAIASLKNGKVYFELNEQVGDAMNAFTAPAQPTTSSDEQKISSVSAIFEAMPNAFNAEAAKDVDVTFQYHISGDGGGDWNCIIKNGSCTIDSGTHEKPTCTLKIADTDFVDMINGVLPAMQAYTSGKLKIEGDIMKSQLIEKLFKL
ncbi:MAG: SDR family NAD(P)-dependent oxidoreductase [Desulfobacteraceae bacterium]|nr:SDR family NAD(P)-dependent oxidoreductase [Desulfobacteraceae bacterium]MBC2757103.1 SDR family NAD(P)-dependent oxidoreductase [Desulfobacteraceae bacterium]MBC2763681.1 SDR family NAD(P)-dependent oxidoreductase [ANME-2 cluster archaeon]